MRDARKLPSKKMRFEEDASADQMSIYLDIYLKKINLKNVKIHFYISDIRL